MFAQLISTLKKSPKTIVFTEGTDPRILEASARLLSGNFLKPVLVGNPDEIADAAEDIGFNIRGAEIIDPENYDGMDEMVDKMVELRKGKMTADECRAALKKSNYFGTMLVKMGKADCLLGGATYSTADTVRPALQLIKTKPGNKIVSSCFIMVRPAASGENEVLAMADCAINIKPNEDELVEICKETVSCAKIFGVDPKTGGEIFLDGKEVKISCPMDAIKAGIVLAPEDRKKDGLCTKLSIRHNLALPNLDLICSKLGVISRKQEDDLCEKAVKDLLIKTPTVEVNAGNLSGGNQQKVVVGKWLARNSRVVIFDEPTRGIDVGAKVEIYNLMNQLKKQGIAVMFVSSEMPEVLGIADRVIVMCDGRITGEVIAKETTQNEVLKFATEFEQKKAVG